MKTIAKIFSAAMLIFSAAAFTSCKDKETTTETDTTIITDDTGSTVDTVQTAPINDSNVSGVTSGKMEQVP